MDGADFAGVKAVVFDVDGTLYQRGPVQRDVGFEALRKLWRRPLQLSRVVAAVRAYRRALEQLRHGGGNETYDVSVPLRRRQLELAELTCGYPADEIESIVAEWLEKAPLLHLKKHRMRGLVAFLEHCKSRGIVLAVYSDYPAEAKLHSLGILPFFSVVRSSQDGTIGLPKPSPHGLQVTMRDMGVEPKCTIYVGDRSGVDDAVAMAAGVRSILVGANLRQLVLRGKRQGAVGHTVCRDYLELAQMGIFD